MKRLFSLLLVLSTNAHSAIVEIDYLIVPSSATGDAITIPNPDGGEFLVTPSAGITGGNMTVRFSSDEDGLIGDGSAFITTLEFLGEINLRATTGQQIFGQDIFVDITGPLTGIQNTGSAGNLSGEANYSESITGSYNTLFGPTGCSGNFFNIGCLALEALAGVEFPIDGIAGDGIPLAILNGAFTNLNGSGISTAQNSFEFPVEVGGGIGAPLPIELAWTEVDRRFVVIPEPHTGLLAFVAFGLLAFRRGRQ